MAFCTKCGKPLSDGAKFCTACGNPVSAAPVVTESPKVEEVIEVVAPVVEETVVETVAPVVEETVVETAAAVEETVTETAAAVEETVTETTAAVEETVVETAAAVEETVVETAAPVVEEVVKVEAPVEEATPEVTPTTPVEEAAPEVAPITPVVTPVAPVAPVVTPVPVEAPAKENPRTKVAGFASFFWLSALFALPFVGSIAVIVFCFAPKNQNIKNWARAKLVWALIGFVFWCAIFIVLAITMSKLTSAMDVSRLLRQLFAVISRYFNGLF